MLKYLSLSLLAVALIGCSSDSSTTTSSSTASSTTEATSSSTTSAAAKFEIPKQPANPVMGPGTVKNGDEVAVIDTNLGRIVFKFLNDKAPKTIKNFEELAKKGFYDGTKFHRVIPGFMIQGGDPNTKDDDRSNDGSGGPGYTIDDEFSDVHHSAGIVSMAHTSEPNSGGSQFFICVADASHLDGKYSAFGQVVQGMDVVQKIVDLPQDPNNNPLPENPAIMQSVRIEKWPLK